jgi:hypothetical protein
MFRISAILEYVLHMSMVLDLIYKKLKLTNLRLN